MIKVESMAQLIIQNNTKSEIQIRTDKGKITKLDPKYKGRYQVVINYPTQDFEGKSLVIENID